MFLKLNDLLSDEDLKVTDSDVIKAFKSLGYKSVKMKGK